ANDFNTPGALATLFTLIREFNRTLAEPLAQATPSVVLGAGELIKVIEEDIGGILGIGRSNPVRMLEDIARIRAARTSMPESARMPEAEILEKIQARADARKNKDFQAADTIRKALEARGVLIKDSPTGTTWIYG
ncbi:MAG: DALR domain-containing protein, partial [Bdellovibrionia bacterium]